MVNTKKKCPKKKNFKKRHYCKTPVQKTILVVIILAIITVLFSVIFTLVFTTERQVKTKISSLASSYYEDYFYPNIISDNNNTPKIVEHYSGTGFSKVSLRQIILSNQKITASEADFLRKYCNENDTLVQFFPESPYDKTSYRVEFTYSCNF